MQQGAGLDVLGRVYYVSVYRSKWWCLSNMALQLDIAIQNIFPPEPLFPPSPTQPSGPAAEIVGGP